MMTPKFLSESGKYAESLELAQPICVVSFDEVVIAGSIELYNWI